MVTAAATAAAAAAALTKKAAKADGEIGQNGDEGSRRSWGWLMVEMGGSGRLGGGGWY